MEFSFFSYRSLGFSLRKDKDVLPFKVLNLKSGNGNQIVHVGYANTQQILSATCWFSLNMHKVFFNTNAHFLYICIYISTTVIVIMFCCQYILFIQVIQFRCRCDICKKLIAHIFRYCVIFILPVVVNWLYIIW